MVASPVGQRVRDGLVTLAILAGLTVLGDALAAALHLPIPGPLLGSAILVAWLVWRPTHAEALASADVLIAALPLLFLPLLVEAVGPLRALGPALLPVALTMTVATVAALGAAIAAARIAAWLCSRSR
jgi:holin-like protein